MIRILERISTQTRKAAVLAVVLWVVGIVDIAAAILFQLAGWQLAYFVAFGFLCLFLVGFAGCTVCLAIQSIFGQGAPGHRQSNDSGFDLALLVAITNKVASAVFAAASPLIAVLIISQGGLGTVPVHNGTGEVIGHVNNVLAALVFSSLWLAGSLYFFHVAKRYEAKIRDKRNLVGREDRA